MVDLHLRIVTPDATIVDTNVRSVQFMGVDGAYGILANHAPLMTATLPGEVAIEHTDGRTEHLLVTDGFAEARDNTLSLICEAGELASKIDIERAAEAERKAREKLADRGNLSVDELVAAEAALRRAMMRQLVAGKGTANVR